MLIKFFYSLIAYVNVLFFFLLFNFLFPFYLIFRLFGLENKFLKFNFIIMRAGIKITLFLVKIKVVVTGESNISKKEKMVVVANHIAAMDPIFLIYVFPNPFAMISKFSLLYVPVINFMLIGMGAIFINRKSIKSSVKTIKKAISIINLGRSVGIFPEGTRNRGGLTKNFKKGSIKIALESGVNILPVTFLNTNKFFIKNFIFNVGTIIYVHIHPKVDISKLTENEKSNLYINVREEIVKKLEEMKTKYKVS